MKHLLLITFISGSLLLGCKDSSESVGDMPAIESISFVGLPDENVTFDPRNSLITVRMPAVLEGGLKPVLKMTPGAQPVGLMSDGRVDISAFCRGSQNEPTYLRVANRTKTAAYRLNIIATGPLAAQDVYEETTFSRQSTMLKLSLPVQNQYNYVHLTRIVFENEDGSEPVVITADGATLAGCSSQPNRLSVELYSPIQQVLKPGRYKIQIGNIKFPQRLIVVD
ncbi:hypothetical protein SAMN04487996_1173 [Dyadobacter soli]|uniref:Uncharacterized protein n=1 Tax=Dyadobacter soli TaxID=659014 RepID=A0A1G7SXX2_9BACT|nr:hypothetical protein [Dyadobacter soli]SDG27160.1 hypothetical protein SAMN04487996_1173 [Dyadobacter soli]